MRIGDRLSMKIAAVTTLGAEAGSADVLSSLHPRWKLIP
jgi:hypothetical protein